MTSSSPLEPQVPRVSQVARLQQLLSALGALGAVAWAVYFHTDPAMAWGGVGVLVGVSTGVLAVQFMCQWPSAGQVVNQWLGGVHWRWLGGTRW